MKKLDRACLARIMPRTNRNTRKSSQLCLSQ